MLQGIDHIVIVVSDLEQAAKDYEQLGFTTVGGMRCKKASVWSISACRRTILRAIH